MIWDKGTSEVKMLSWASTYPDDSLTTEFQPWLNAGAQTLYELDILYYVDTDEIPRLFPEMPRWLRRIAPAWLIRWWYA